MDKKIILGGIIYFVYALVVSIIFVTTQNMFIFFHENAHVQINRGFGLNSTVEYGFLGLSGKTTTYLGEMPNESIREWEFQSALNEIIGYNIEALFFPLSIIAGCLVVITIKIISDFVQ